MGVPFGQILDLLHLEMGKLLRTAFTRERFDSVVLLEVVARAADGQRAASEIACECLACDPGLSGCKNLDSAFQVLKKSRGSSKIRGDRIRWKRHQPDHRLIPIQ